MELVLLAVVLAVLRWLAGGAALEGDAGKLAAPSERELLGWWVVAVFAAGLGLWRRVEQLRA